MRITDLNTSHWRLALYALPFFSALTAATEAIEPPGLWLGAGLGAGYAEAQLKSAGDTSTTGPNTTTKLALGYDINTQFGFYGSYDFLWHDNLEEGDLHIGSLGVRGMWPIDEQWRVFAKAGVSQVAQGHGDSGPAGSVGAGVAYQLSRAMSLNAGLDYYDRLEWSSDKTVNVTQAYLGIEYYFNHRERVNTPAPLIKQDAPPKAAPKAQPKMKEVTYTLNNFTSLFATNSSWLQEHDSLQPALALIKRNPTEPIKVVGHTDNTGTQTYNLWLSKRRAQAVADYFISQGIEASRFTILGKGALEPIAGNHSKSERAKNRRVDIMVSTTEQ
ncbi:OmpA family protein [Vibrio cyclitrophicus]|nr:OmpA family protein [Vibrio cyclitrophicus]PMJ41228.1 hypothetical protein BCU22_12635 [Vibrio cyclitrophicus]